jgi:hypothetical protein
VDPPGPGSATWPDDWRTQFAGDNKDAQAAMARYDSPTAVAKALLAAQQKIRSGEYKRVAPPPEGADDAAMATWRKDNGLPEKPEDYQILPAGTAMESLDEGAKAALGHFQKGFIGANLSQDQAKKVSQTLYEMAETQMAEQATADAEQMNQVEDALRADWGADFRNNVVMNKGHAVKTFGEELGNDIFHARLPDGSILGNSVAFSKALNAWARAEGGDILYGGNPGANATVDSRIAEIEGYMKGDMAKYTPTVADEYLKLIEKREARGGRQ